MSIRPFCRYTLSVGATAFSFSLLVNGCSAEMPTDEVQTEPILHGTAWSSDNPETVQPQAAPHLSYYGGPVLQNVKIAAVFWSPNVAKTIQTGIPDFYSNIVNSPYIDWLSEYNTTNPKQSIARGSYAGKFTITPSITATTLADSQIQGELSRQIAAGKLPKPDSNTLYMVHFPPGVKITQGKSASCVAGGFCAYHGTYALNNQNVYYGVLPDIGPGSGCDLGCGRAASQFDNQTSVASHEMVESITDAGVGLATVYGPPLGWYDQANGEIGDICNAQQGTIATNGVTYTVQKQWSNQAGGCFVIRPVVQSDFSLVVTPPSQIIGQHATTSCTIQTTTVSGMAPSITLSLSGLPTGVTGSFNPPTLISGSSSTLTLVSSATAPANTATFLVTGAGVGMSHAATAQIGVVAPTTNLITNGDFETGKTTGWITSSMTSISSNAPHSGKSSALLGLTTPYTTEGTLSQSIMLPSSGVTTLSFWYKPVCNGTIATDWQQVQLLDTKSGAVIRTLLRTCSTSAWTQLSADVTPYSGRSVTISFQAHDDGHPNTPSWMQVDDVSVTNR